MLLGVEVAGVIIVVYADVVDVGGADADSGTDVRCVARVEGDVVVVDDDEFRTMLGGRVHRCTTSAASSASSSRSCVRSSADNWTNCSDCTVSARQRVLTPLSAPSLLQSVELPGIVVVVVVVVVVRSLNTRRMAVEVVV